MHISSTCIYTSSNDSDLIRIELYFRKMIICRIEAMYFYYKIRNMCTTVIKCDDMII